MSDEPGRNLRTHRAPPGLVGRALAGRRSPRPPRRIGLQLAGMALAGVLAVVGGWGWGVSERTRALPMERGAEARAGVASRAVRSVRIALRQAGARTVSVAGTWNGWDATATPMRPGRDGTFEVTVQLEPGRYEYQFVLDGERWITDPDALLTVDDGFGNENMLLEL